LEVLKGLEVFISAEVLISMAVQDIPPAVQEKLRQLELMGQQLEITRSQIDQISAALMDVERATKNLEALDPSEEVYKNIGRVLVKAPAGKVLEELKDRKETLDLRKTTLEKQESRLKKQFEEKRQSLTESVGGLAQLS
jgi:prefoldin beta subunit